MVSNCLCGRVGRVQVEQCGTTRESVCCVDVRSVERPWTDIKSREDDPAAYNACDDASVSQDKLRAQVKCEDESHVDWKCMHVIELHFCLLLSATRPMHRQGPRQVIIIQLTAPTLAFDALSVRRVVHSAQQ